MISVNDLKTGLTLQLDNGLWSVVEFLHVKPGKGAAFVRSKHSVLVKKLQKQCLTDEKCNIFTKKVKNTL